MFYSLSLYAKFVVPNLFTWVDSAVFVTYHSQRH